MRPVLFEVYGLKVHAYGVLLVISFLAAIWFGQRRAPRFRLTKDDVLDAGFWGVLLGILGARALYIAQEWDSYAGNWGEIFKLQFDGLTSFGGLIGGFLGLVFWALKSRKSLIAMLDVASACFLLAHPIGRLGCLLNGCCYGHACDLPWGVHVEGREGLFHPAQVYDGLLNLAALALLLWFERRGLKLGQSIGMFFILHGLTRIVYEFWRAGTSSTYWGNLPFTEAQAAAAGMVVIGIAVFVWRGIVGRPQGAPPPEPSPEPSPVAEEPVVP